jgi:hypothetical protein
MAANKKWLYMHNMLPAVILLGHYRTSYYVLVI